MVKTTVIVPLPKPRNPFHRDLTLLGKKIVKARKGKGSYKRNSRFIPSP